MLCVRSIEETPNNLQQFCELLARKNHLVVKMLAEDLEEQGSAPSSLVT